MFYLLLSKNDVEAKFSARNVVRQTSIQQRTVVSNGMLKQKWQPF